MIALAWAWAEVAAPISISVPRGLDACRQWAAGARCQEGSFEVTVRAKPLGDTRPSSMRVGRFLQMSDWPQCTFEPAFLDGMSGHQARCDDGERAWIARWWVVDGWMYSQAASGPAGGLAEVADRWFERVQFQGKTIRAPTLPR